MTRNMMALYVLGIILNKNLFLCGVWFTSLRSVPNIVSKTKNSTFDSKGSGTIFFVVFLWDHFSSEFNKRYRKNINFGFNQHMEFSYECS